MQKLFFVIIFLQFFFAICQVCFDQYCLECTKDGTYCFKCRKGFERHYSICGKKCKSIKNCQTCNVEETRCIKCKSNCIFNGKYCDCTERYVLFFVCFTFSVAMISVIYCCFAHPSSTYWRRRFRLLNIFPVQNNNISIFNDSRNHPSSLHEETNINISNRINELELIKEFNNNKIEVDKDIENKMCCICNNNNCNLKLGCGCFICYDCEKKCITVGKCLKCNQEIKTMQQISCSICFCNKKEISTFNCQCKIVICKACFLKWRKENNFCPSCRGPIY